MWLFSTEIDVKSMNVGDLYSITLFYLERLYFY
jgi:hypothetical protein